MRIHLRTTLLTLAAGIIVLLLFSSRAYAVDVSALLQNPLNAAISSIPKFIAEVLKVVVKIAIPIIALFLVYAGFLFVRAQGNMQQLARARDNLMYAVIGALLIMGAWVLATLIAGTVTQLVGS